MQRQVTTRTFCYLTSLCCCKNEPGNSSQGKSTSSNVGRKFNFQEEKKPCNFDHLSNQACIVEKQKGKLWPVSDHVQTQSCVASHFYIALGDWTSLKIFIIFFFLSLVFFLFSTRKMSGKCIAGKTNWEGKWGYSRVISLSVTESANRRWDFRDQRWNVRRNNKPKSP